MFDSVGVFIALKAGLSSVISFRRVSFKIKALESCGDVEWQWQCTLLNVGPINVSASVRLQRVSSENESSI